MARDARSTGIVVLTLLALVAAGCTDRRPAATAPAATAPAAAPSSSAPAAPSAAPSLASVIPAAALLQPGDLNGAKFTPMAAGDGAHLRPLRPCAAKYPSDATRTAAVAVQAHVVEAPGETPRVLMQYVGLHPGTAAQAFEEIAAAVRACPGSLDPGQLRWEVAGSADAGDESLFVRVSERFSYGDPANVVTPVTPAVLMRVGDRVTVVADLGWESSGGDEAWVLRLAAIAAERLRTAA
ncbi:hypothetical protein ACFFX1_19555 [Dactylosporangium sucinum]|uniref:PknH-like extracellular domain-containing protein n=1 Tax=Dactylosporangium sucinum TaxID=1424081 RepID=A0A917U3B2_9ACTN|nr:hypothetical protein [Dactylosporangium sucinum]GGM55076.1 hypothetical protein GCM10007977_065960 [Dactylosporangium sucinum]